MKRVLMLAVVAGTGVLSGPASVAAAWDVDACGSGAAVAAGSVGAAGRSDVAAIETGIGLDWCRSGGVALGSRRGDDGGIGDDDDRNERGNGDAPGGSDLDGGRYADDHGDPRAGGERWERADWGDVRFRLSGAVLGVELNAAQLTSLLGRGVVSRLSRHAYDQRVEGELRGRWLDDDPRVLRVYGGRVPLAEFTDRDGDERVDLLRLAFWR